MDASVDEDLDLIRALRLTAAPPQAWIDAAAMIPSTLGDLDRIEAVVADPGFRANFARDPAQALADEGLPSTAPVMAAVRERLA
jgi:hypothetical protein